LPQLRVRVVDVNAASLAHGRALAARLGLGPGRVTFDEADFLAEIQPAGTAPAGRAAPDAIVALHACGGLTDAILAYAAATAPSAACVVVTCCFSSHASLAEAAWARTGAPEGLWTAQLQDCQSAAAVMGGGCCDGGDAAAPGHTSSSSTAAGDCSATADSSRPAEAARLPTAAPEYLVPLLRRTAEMVSVPEAATAMHCVNALRLRGLRAAGEALTAGASTGASSATGLPPQAQLSYLRQARVVAMDPALSVKNQVLLLGRNLDSASP
jgi:dienelactone hydrolase